MIHHTFDQDPENPLCFVWSEVYKDDEAFLAHLANPPVGEYLQGHAELGDNFTVEVYGTVGDKCKSGSLSGTCNSRKTCDYNELLTIAMCGKDLSFLFCK